MIGGGRSMKTIRGIISIVLLTAILFSGCASQTAPQSDSVDESQPSQEQSVTQEAAGQTEGDGKITVTDQAGREVMIDSEPNKIVSGYYISSSACIALGLTDKLVGIEAKAASRPIYGLAAPQLLELPDVGTAKEFNLEGCIALKPDLVILPLRLRETADILTEMDIPVILVDPEDHEKLQEMITLIGMVTGTSDKADKMVEYYQNELAAVISLTKDLTDKPSVYMSGNTSYLETATLQMYQASLVEAAGGTNVAGEIDGDVWTEISYEQLIAMNPEVIIVPSEAAYTVDDVLGDEQLKDVKAIQENKVYRVPGNIEAWDSPVPSCTLGIKWLLQTLHGDIYSFESLQSDAEAFYREFYNIEIDKDMIGK